MLRSRRNRKAWTEQVLRVAQTGPFAGWWWCQGYPRRQAAVRQTTGAAGMVRRWLKNNMIGVCETRNGVSSLTGAY